MSKLERNTAQKIFTDGYFICNSSVSSRNFSVNTMSKSVLQLQRHCTKGFQALEDTHTFIFTINVVQACETLEISQRRTGTLGKDCEARNQISGFGSGYSVRHLKFWSPAPVSTS